MPRFSVKVEKTTIETTTIELEAMSEDDVSKMVEDASFVENDTSTLLAKCVWDLEDMNYAVEEITEED